MLKVYPWQESQWQALLARKSALPHALLFKGQAGTGKLELVRKLAQSIACESAAPEGAGCGVCRSCRWFAAGTHPDYRELLPEALRPPADEEASARGRNPREEIVVDDIRALGDFINLSAHLPGGKTVVVHPAETMNRNAANALLKSLEEPPPGTRFMLVTHRAGYLPATIVSRCQQVALPTPPAQASARWLVEQGVSEPGLRLAQAGFAPLAALQLSDEEFWSQRKVLLDALSHLRIEPLPLAERVRDYSPASLLSWLQRWAYDLLAVKSAGRVRYNPDFRPALERLAARLNARQVAGFLRYLVREQRTIHHPLNARLVIEQLLIAYATLLRGEPAHGGHAG